MLRTIFAALALVLPADSADLWLRQVSPVITRAERETYATLPEGRKNEFQNAFWAGRSIQPQEYFKRLAYADSAYGSGALLSGTNTDRGRVHLALGTPSRVTRLASSRVFVPLEIWYYDAPPALGSAPSAQFLFFSKREGSEPRLYSPAIDTIRALLLPTSSTRGLFPLNDSLNENDIRNRLNLSPAEEEAVEPALRVIRGITGLGNDEVIGIALSPRMALNHPLQPRVRSRLTAAGDLPMIEVRTTIDDRNQRTSDIAVNCTAKAEIRLRLLAGTTVVDDTSTSLAWPQSARLRYLHRFALPDGDYQILAECDGRVASSHFVVKAEPSASLLVGTAGTQPPLGSPFVFGGHAVVPSSSPAVAVAYVPGANTVRWRVSKGIQIVWSTMSEVAGGWSRITLPENLAPGRYDISAGDQTEPFTVHVNPAESAVVCYRANLSGDSPALLEARVLLARRDPDGARRVLEPVLQRTPGDSGALAAMGLVSFEFQDYRMAERYLRRALETNPAPALQAALEQAIAKQKTLKGVTN